MNPPETQPASSASPAEGLHEITSAPHSNPWCLQYVPDPAEEELWRQSVERAKQAGEKVLDDRAMEIATALDAEFSIGYYNYWAEPPFSHSPLPPIAAIIRPFLAKPTSRHER